MTSDQLQNPDSPNARGLFITLEGVDGAGKSTHVRWIADRIADRGIPVITTREPGGTELGEELRSLLLHKNMDVSTELLLMFAARNEHLEALIKPALRKGTWVVCDRFTDATYAYQGGGRRVGESRIAVLESWVHDTLHPDRTFLFDVPLAVAQERLHGGRERDRFEQEEIDFFKRTRAAYLNRVTQDESRFCVVDSSGPLADTRNTLQGELDKLFDAEDASGPAQA